MTNLAGLPSYFWFTSSSPKESAQDGVAYTTAALRQDLLRVRNAWEECQSNRNRDAIYSYLTAVFSLVEWWETDRRSHQRASKALRLQHLGTFEHEDPFAAIIRCTSDPAKVDKRTRSKWSRVLRYALRYKDHAESLDQFIKRNGGINACANRFTQYLGRSRSNRLTLFEARRKERRKSVD
jgi:hypothetical protein